MTHVAISCPRLVFALGVQLTARAGRREDPAALANTLARLGGPVRRGAGARWFSVELADSADALLALLELMVAVPDHDPELQSVVASAAAMELVLDDPSPNVAGAIRQLRDMFSVVDNRMVLAAPPIDLSRGCAAARHFTRLLPHPVPDAIANDELPAGDGVVLWSVADGRVVLVDRAPFTIGRDPLCDLSLATPAASRRHLEIDRTVDGWAVRDLQAASGFSVNGLRTDRCDLAPGMVIQLAIPFALVVLAVR